MNKEYLSMMSKLTNISESILRQLFKLNLLTISHNISEQLVDSEDSFSVNLATYGVLDIRVAGNDISYKFTPSLEMHRLIQKTIIENKSQLEQGAEDRLVELLLKSYKELV